MGEGGARSGISFGAFFRYILGSKMVASFVQNLANFESNFGLFFLVFLVFLVYKCSSCLHFLLAFLGCSFLRFSCFLWKPFMLVVVFFLAASSAKSALRASSSSWSSWSSLGFYNGCLTHGRDRKLVRHPAAYRAQRGSCVSLGFCKGNLADRNVGRRSDPQSWPYRYQAKSMIRAATGMPQVA